jgi:hypothetical protein
VPDEQPQRGTGRGRIRGRRETPLELAERIADAYGLVLLLIIITFVVMMTLPPEGWGGRVCGASRSPGSRRSWRSRAPTSAQRAYAWRW